MNSGSAKAGLRTSIACRMVFGSSLKKASSRSRSYLKLPGNCQQTAPSLSPSACTELKKSSTGCSTSFSRLMWVTAWWPFTVNTKPGGVAAAQFSKLAGFWFW